jgi:chemotaxis protein MotB
MIKKKRDEEKKAGIPAWMQTYGDTMSLLLVFFILLVSVSNMQIDKLKQATQSLKGSFGVLPYQNRVQPAPLTSTYSLRGETAHGRRTRALDRLQQVIRENNLQNVIRVRENDQGVHITIGNPALFDSGIAEIKPSVMPVLDQIVQVVRSGTENVRVEGHTDNVPIHNDLYASNWELSIARALSVVRYIRNIYPEIDPQRLRPVGCAEFHPVSSNDTEEGRAVNRRVEIYIDIEQ